MQQSTDSVAAAPVRRLLLAFLLCTVGEIALFLITTVVCCSLALVGAWQVFCSHVETLARRGKKQVVPEGLYDALIAVVDLLQKMVSVSIVVVSIVVVQEMVSVSIQLGVILTAK